MDEANLISIIVPIYRTEEFLNKCIDSLCAQTYKNIEIILVDDGSPDKCGEICEEYAGKDKRIVVIHKSNDGLSSARNAGLDIARGEYIGFVDSDDWIEKDMYEKMLSFLYKMECDLVECAVNIVKNHDITVYAKQVSEVISGRMALMKHLNANCNNYMPRVSVWSKLYKREFWNERRFPEGKIHEDYMLTCESLYEASKIGLIKEGLYNHLVTNRGSIMNRKFSKKDLFLEEQYRSRWMYLKQKGETKLAVLARNKYYLLLLTLYWRCVYANMEEQGYYLQIIRNHRSEIFRCAIEKKRLFEFILLHLSPRFYIILRKIFTLIRSKMKNLRFT